MRQEDQEIHNEILDTVAQFEMENLREASVIVIDQVTWWRLKNIHHHYHPPHHHKPEEEPEERYAGIPIAVKLHQKKRYISVH